MPFFICLNINNICKQHMYIYCREQTRITKNIYVTKQKQKQSIKTNNKKVTTTAITNTTTTTRRYGMHNRSVW